jgi:hypothetical protein
VFDFRYHALSLVAVFIALAVGLVLGVTIGDKGVLTSARRELSANLVSRARDRASTLSNELNVRREFEQETYPALVADRLAGERFGLVFLGGASDTIARRVSDALDGTGGSLRFVAVVRDTPNLGELAARAGATRYAGLADDPTLLQPFAQAVGRSIVRGGSLAIDERQPLLSSFSGELGGGVNGVIVARLGETPTGDQADEIRALQEGLVQGMADTDASVVGVETTTSEPSQVPWYQERGISTVDDIDDIAGLTALVYVLAGAKGDYGVKPIAEALVPRLVGTTTPAP